MTQPASGYRVLYLHGLESGPRAGKVVTLRAAGFDVHAPQLDTSAATALVYAGNLDAEAYSRALEAPLAQAAEAVATAKPEVIVGSSFGAAVLLRLIHEHPIDGAAVVLLAGAGRKMTTYTALPPGPRVVLVHGRGDVVIPYEDSRTLAATSPRAVMVEVDDDHRLTETTRSGLLCELVRLAHRLR